MIVYGIPKKLRNTDELSYFALKQLPEAVASIPEMGITTDLVSVFMPADMLDEDLGSEIIVFAEGLFMRDERTPEVRQKFADAVRDSVVEFALEYVPRCKMVEVVPRSQQPDDGFADWRKGD